MVSQICILLSFVKIHRPFNVFEKNFFLISGPEMSRLPNEIISSSRRTSKISRNDENLYDKCLLSTSSFEQCSSRFPVLEQYDGRLLRCSRTGIHSKRSSGQLYYGDIRRASMPVAFTAFVNRCEFTWESAPSLFIECCTSALVTN